MRILEGRSRDSFSAESGAEAAMFQAGGPVSVYHRVILWCTARGDWGRRPGAGRAPVVYAAARRAGREVVLHPSLARSASARVVIRGVSRTPPDQSHVTEAVGELGHDGHAGVLDEQCFENADFARLGAVLGWPISRLRPHHRHFGAREARGRRDAPLTLAAAATQRRRAAAHAAPGSGRVCTFNICTKQLKTFV